MMSGRRDGSLMRSNVHSIRGSRIAIAIGIGILLGCVFAFCFPHGFFASNSPSPIKNRRIATTNLQNAELKKQVRELTEKLRLQVLVMGNPHKAGPFGTVKSLRTNPTTAKLLEKVAFRKELIVCLVNSNRVGIPNYLVVALDDDIANFCELNHVPVYKRDPDQNVDEIERTGGNHAVSGLKFRVLRSSCNLVTVFFLSDVDIVYLQDPFDHIYRDSDVESMTDGHNNSTAYGFNDVFDEPSMGWARYAHTMRVWVFNSGFFYIRPTIPAIELLDRVADRLAKENAWDQAVFNEELFYPSHPGYEGLHASKRVMDYYSFMNSKVLFKTVRKDDKLRKLKPLPRMKAVVDFYVNGNQDALQAFPDGSE
ncbi:hypothetical protein MKW92_033134 [Papaver armeniacum]|nr:hypothetical protein MKW92_033134 [Papaver armeniacum]